MADAVVLVTPQYNWGYPAALKNALDHLYREWRGKPAVIVTYGQRGGGKCAKQLRQVADGLHMRTVGVMPGLRLPRAVIEANDGSVEFVENICANHVAQVGPVTRHQMLFLNYNYPVSLGYGVEDRL